MNVRMAVLPLLALAGGILLTEAHADDKTKSKEPAQVSPGNIPPNSADAAPPEAREFLRIHNEARTRVGLPALRWSATLARHAQEWADQLAASGQFKHREQTGTGYGENLFGGSDGFGPEDAARRWLKERAAYDGGPITAKNFSAVGHYTQMVWRDTTEVGFGFARGRKGVVVVANYAPAGNLVGRKPY